ncbi:dienelactone hydrolase family protein [Coralloluteibacterium stylophorae]|uniref:Dienelactone hydrolase family protein n=1 Tax=Coralloluteibacterium stylophorae TaxID=1776034 RepID=A0A8J8AX35_9GAMM|nr:dienelactone hydrolase family protein [Coralloluteibacterium stylophorae]MBS7456697.1 dienelactone hydrolase family protein [Coralloluteibacterium stylophorae]
MRAEPLRWSLDGADFEGVLVYDDADQGRRPGVLMVPNWMGVTEAAVEEAREVAAGGYVVLVADVYGKEVRPADAQAARRQVERMYADRGLLRARAARALDALQAQADAAPLDPQRLAGMGFCFGGSTILELARSGEERLAGVVSLHGGLATDRPARGDLPAAVLVLNGAADTSVSDADIAAFQAEMDAVDADWQLVEFGGARHCFAEEAAGDGPGNCRYDARAARRAERLVEAFFEEIL